MLTEAKLSDFPSLYSLLQHSFPADEYRPFEAQLALLRDSRYCLLTNNENTLFLSLWRFPGFTFLEHFAVSPALRGQGYGTNVLQEVMRRVPGPFVLEAELPDTAIARRRLDFYRRNGFLVQKQDYLQPAYSPDRNPVPMKLLSTTPLSDKDFITIRESIYKEVYII